MIALIAAIAVACPAGNQLAVKRGDALEVVARAANVRVVGRDVSTLGFSSSEVTCQKLGNVYRLETMGEATELRIELPSWMPMIVSAGVGDVDIEGSLASLELSAPRGDIRVRGGRGRIAARTVTGSVDVAGAEGSIDITVQSRPVRLASSSGDISITNVTGITTLDDVRAKGLRISTVTGEAICRCIPSADSEWDLRASSGAVRLYLPDQVNAVVSLDAPANAAISSYPGAVIQEIDRRRLTAILGKGGGRIRLTSFSGAVFLARTTNPPRAGPRKD